MKTTQIALLGIIPAALLTIACGDDVTQVTKIEETSGLEIVASADSLGKCTAELSGEMKFASKENAVYVCADSAWKNISEAKKTACSAEALSDGSGFKIVCDGDSVGVVKNGTNGTDGKKGEAGKDGANGEGCKLVDGPIREAGSSLVQTSFVICGKDTVGTLSDGRPGEGCDISDIGDGTVSVVCGDASTTLYKAFCGGKVYDPDSNFCVENLIVPQSKKLVWNLMNPDIEYDMFVDDRDGQVYRSVKIGEQTWMAENLNYAMDESSCYNCQKYGRVYTWYAMMSACPTGWQRPLKSDFNTLIATVGGADMAGKALKSTNGWMGSGTDNYGFSALSQDDWSTFFWIGDHIEESDGNMIVQDIGLIAAKGKIFISNTDPTIKNSVRCIKSE